MLPRCSFMAPWIAICLWACVAFAPPQAKASHSQKFSLKPSWQRSCEEDVGGGLLGLPRTEREFLAEKILRGTKLPDVDVRLLIQELADLHARVMGDAEISYRVARTNRERNFHDQGTDLLLSDVEAAIDTLNRSNRIPMANRRVVYWLAHRLLRPQIADLSLNDRGRPLNLPLPGQRGELLFQYLRQKFNFRAEIKATPAAPDGTVYRAVCLQAFTDGPLIAFSPREVLTAEMIEAVLDAAFLNRSYFSRDGFAVLAWSAGSILDLLSLLQKDAWVSFEHNEAQLSAFTDLQTGNMIWLPRDTDPETPLSAAARSSLFMGLMTGQSVLLTAPSDPPASWSQLQTAPRDLQSLN